MSPERTTWIHPPSSPTTFRLVEPVWSTAIRENYLDLPYIHFYNFQVVFLYFSVKFSNSPNPGGYFHIWLTESIRLDSLLYFIFAACDLKFLVHISTPNVSHNLILILWVLLILFSYCTLKYIQIFCWKEGTQGFTSMIIWVCFWKHKHRCRLQTWI